MAPATCHEIQVQGHVNPIPLCPVLTPPTFTAPLLSASLLRLSASVSFLLWVQQFCSEGLHSACGSWDARFVHAEDTSSLAG